MIALLAEVVLILALAALPSTGSAQQAKILRYAFPIAETGFDPAQVTDLYSRIVTHHVFDGLYSYDHLAQPFKIKPNTAPLCRRSRPTFASGRSSFDQAFISRTTRRSKVNGVNYSAGLCLLIQALFRPALEVAELSFAGRAEDRRHGGGAR